MQITNRKCVNTMLELAYIYSVSGELKNVEYWTKYALNIAARSNMSIEILRAQILMASIYIDTKNAEKVKVLLSNIIGEEYPMHLRHLEQLSYNLMLCGGLSIKKDRIANEEREADFPYYQKIMQYIVPMWNIMLDLNNQY